jgi:hypothetical protein
MLNIQRCFIDWELSINEFENKNLENDKFENDDESLFDEIIDDKCNDEIIIHVFSQFKKKHVVDAFFYDVLILDKKHFRFILSQSGDTKAWLRSSHVMWLRWLRWLYFETTKTRLISNSSKYIMNHSF